MILILIVPKQVKGGRLGEMQQGIELDPLHNDLKLDWISTVHGAQVRTPQHRISISII
jgi:hypothetical protein